MLVLITLIIKTQGMEIKVIGRIIDIILSNDTPTCIDEGIQTLEI